MKITNIKINGFGKIKDKEIELENGLNIIYGKNEAGKSTVLKFISSMFYGITKNKNGGLTPEIEKFEPWDCEEYSGKIKYNLDNGETYEVYRDFKKKNPKIFNSNLEDITKDFSVDKTKGSQFFYDQIGLEEEIFTSSIITKQTEVKLDEKMQSTIIQKISNILGTGEDTSSYSSIISKLKKKLNDEVGTSNTKERPINITENNIARLQTEKRELEQYQNYKFEIDDRITQIEKNIELDKNEIDKLRNANIAKEKLNEYESRIKINRDMMNNSEDEIENLEKQLTELNKNKTIKKSKFGIILLIFLIITTILICILNINNIIRTISIAVTLIYGIILILKVQKNKNEEIKLNAEQKEINDKIDILEENKEKQKETLNELQIEYNQKLDNIKKENDIENFDYIIEKIDTKQRKLNEDMLKLHTLKIDNDNVLPKLERLVNIEEEIENLLEEKKELEYKRDNLRRTIDYIEIAYKKMKEQITPKFTDDLSATMEKITNGKYKNVRINTDGRIIVENTNGEYIDIENLSIGTIDQLYLSLRLATIKEITKENMPIILDEAFAYYDDERLTNILQYLLTEHNEKQIIIFTCTKREKEILSKINKKFSFAEL